MTDPEARPFPQTDWEAEQNQVNTDAATVRGDEFIELSKEIAAESAAVAQLTRDAIIADNKKFRRRNGVLVFLVCLLCAVTAGLLWRDVFVNAPQREALVEVTQKLEECTTPGDHEPTVEDPTTGHKCYDDGQARTAAAVTQIVDANNNGEIDSQEILDFLAKFEIFLELADEAPAS